MPTLTLDPKDPVTGFLRELAPLFGSPHGALVAFIRASPLYQEWRAKVGRCTVCRRWLPLLTPDGEIEWHLKPNPQGWPAWVGCQGVHEHAADVAEDPYELAVIAAHIAHRIATVQPGLLTRHG